MIHTHVVDLAYTITLGCSLNTRGYLHRPTVRPLPVSLGSSLPLGGAKCGHTELAVDDCLVVQRL